MKISDVLDDVRRIVRKAEDMFVLFVSSRRSSNIRPGAWFTLHRKGVFPDASDLFVITQKDVMSCFLVR